MRRTVRHQPKLFEVSYSRVFYRAHFRLPSFWVLQVFGFCCFGLASLLVVMPYVRQPRELGYSNLEALLADQMVICFGFFFSSLTLRPVCRTLLRHPLSWLGLQARALVWSVLVGITAALGISHLMIATPDPIEVLEACVKASALLFLWSNLYFSIKQSQQLSFVSAAASVRYGSPDRSPDSRFRLARRYRCLQLRHTLLYPHWLSRPDSFHQRCRMDCRRRRLLGTAYSRWNSSSSRDHEVP